MLLTYSNIRDGVLLCATPKIISTKSVSRCTQAEGRGETHLRVSDHVEEGNDVGAASKVLQDLDLALDLLLLDRLKHLDDALLVVDDVDALKHLRVLAAACRLVSPASRRRWRPAHQEGDIHTNFANDLIVLKHAPAYTKFGLARAFHGSLATGRDPAARTRGRGKRTDVDAVVVPVAARHVLIDVGVDSGHLGCVCRTAGVVERRRRRRKRVQRCPFGEGWAIREPVGSGR